jgi:hypothetical protein
MPLTVCSYGPKLRTDREKKRSVSFLLTPPAGMRVGRNGVQQFSWPPNVGHSEKCWPPFWQVGGSAPPRPPGRGTFAAAVSARHRAPSREFGGHLAPVVNGSPDRPAAARLPLPSAQVTVHHRERSGGVWRPWSMDLRQNCRDEPARDLPPSPAVRFPAQSVDRGHLVPFIFRTWWPRPTNWDPVAAADALRGKPDRR